MDKILLINYPLYYLNIVILSLVFIIGKTTMGATRWLNLYGIGFQPSELVKISIILMLANYFKSSNNLKIKNLLYFFPPIFYTLLPVSLILLQPNLGTSMIILLISFTMTMMVFNRIKIVIFLFCILIFSTPFIWKFGMHDYQKQRVLTFLNPENDSSGAGYNIIQSKIAIGSGGLFGKGYLNGSQSKLQFLPEQHNDFIFSVLAEEFGFVLVLLIIFLYFILLFQITQIAIEVKNITYKMILFGCGGLIFWHLTINTFMTMDLIPVVGVPLPFISYGRSFLLTNILCMSLVINIIRREYLIKQEIKMPI